ncbi:MAG TPA: tetratricopeptide repeat protein [Thioalkalivibrio sp.]|nr:tetratricopeptide repeat protein [Thioalkalivibrio sp.]
MTMIERFQSMLDAGQDNAMLRFSLGNALLADGRADEAVPHLRAAVGHDPKYSAAWKMLGKALAECGDQAAAIEAFDQGIAVAEEKGDKQAAKEMSVFRRRAHKQLGGAVG